MTKKTLIYKIEFFSYWHTSSGLSAGTESNLVVLKNEYNLPVIKGRTLKGLLRDAAMQLHKYNTNVVSKIFIEKIFGIGEDEEVMLKDSYKPKTVESYCFFTNAELSQYLSEQVSEEDTSYFYANLSSTAIDKNGLAKESALRTIEVTAPLTLYARIDDFPEKYEEEIKRCFQWIKRMGLNRHRGLGRCQFSIQEIL